MKKEPHVSQYIDDEERELIDLIESDDYVPGPSLLTPELKAQAERMAENTLNEPTEKISIRINRSDLARIKAQAFEEGMPYQTLIKSILHKVANKRRTLLYPPEES